ncbi:MAG TPA: BatD family protein [Opitutus sp.]|nr:BatD family protein [Opitutus sp.]
MLPLPTRRALWRPFLVVFAALFASLAAHAQSVRWEPSDSGDPAEILLVFENCTPQGDPQLPRLDGTTLAFAGRSEQTSIVNFSMTRSTIFSYRARSTRSGPIQIPAFTVQTDKGAIRVPAFTGGATRSASDANVVSRLEPGAPSVWAGEVFPLTYVLDVARRAFNQLGTNIEWNAAPLIVEDWSKFEPTETTSNGESRLHITATTRGYAKSPGPITLNAANQLVNLQSGSIGFGLFQTPRIEQLSVTSNQPSIVVRPLPPATAGFTGAVGQFKLASKVVPSNAAVGEPVTWTLELSGTGNWPDIAGLPQRDVSKDFSVVQPQAKRTPAEGKLFDVTLTEDVVLVPTKAGTYTLGPVSFVYFDPAAGTYKTLNTPRTSVTIAAAEPATTPTPAAESAPSNGAAGDPALSAQNRTPQLPPPPAAPLGLPRDPLSGSSTTLVPLSASSVAILAGIPFVLLAGFWLWLAAQRARRTDPLRPLRESRQRLAATLAQLRTSGASQAAETRSRLLLQWQHDTSILWRIPHAAPPATALPDAAWIALWTEADRALYSSAPSLPPDWVSRAEAALAAKRLPGFSLFRLFLPGNLLPFVAGVALLWSVLPSPALAAAASDNAEAAYRSGDFARAEKTWSATLAKEPTDSIARHNLSLALAQQDRWAEAAAHAAVAFVQNPSSEATRWQLALAAEKAGYVPAPLAAFLPAGPLQALARRASPATWQLALVLAAVVVAAAFGVLLYAAYRGSSRRVRWGAVSGLISGVLLAAAALASLHAYQLTADARAVVSWRAGTLRSIPTEADNAQKTTVLPAGSLAVADKTFLGWTRLSFANGQTGWVRQEEVIALWR